MRKIYFSTSLFATSIVLSWALASLAQAKPDSTDPLTPLRLYNGSWQLTVNGTGKSVRIDNRCEPIGKFFACEQSVNGQVQLLVVFVPSGREDEYSVQNISTDGESGSKTVLTIGGTRWTYTSKEKSNGKTVYYRTTNDFRDTDHIHFEQFQSDDGQHWKSVRSGEEKRL